MVNIKNINFAIVESLANVFGEADKFKTAELTIYINIDVAVGGVGAFSVRPKNYGAFSMVFLEDWSEFVADGVKIVHVIIIA